MTPTRPAWFALTAVALGAIVFAVPHVHWALGGRWTVPPQAPPIAERPVFLVYDLVALAGLLVLAAGCTVIVVRGVPSGREGPVRRLLTGVAVLVGLRGAIGLAQVLVVVVQGRSPGTTAIFDAWFALTAVGLAVVARGTRSASSR